QLDDPLDRALAAAATAVGGRRCLIGRGGRPLAILVAPAGTAATAAATAPAETRLVVVAALLRALLGFGLGNRGDGLIRLPGDDRVDQLGLAQAAEAVDAELVGEQVQIGEWALLQ